jgi:hypothetical protein
MGFDKVTHFVMALSVICIMLTLVAISAQAEDKSMQQAKPVSIDIPAPGLGTQPLNPVEDLISRHIGAIKNREADLAWSMTTEKFHDKYHSAKGYLSHLRLKKRPIYNHDGFSFTEQTQTKGSVIQKIELEDPYGDPVTAIFRVEKQSDGQWLIDSFALLSFEADPI